MVNIYIAISLVVRRSTFLARPVTINELSRHHVCMLMHVSATRIHVYTFIPIHTSSIYVAMLCAFLLGFGDACFNTQVSDISFSTLIISTY